MGGAAIINYKSTQHIANRIHFGFSLLVVDEAHYIKHKNTLRSQNKRIISKHADRLLFMTGTPLENNEFERMTLIRLLQPQIAKQAEHFISTRNIHGFKKITSHVYLRRKRDDVLKELPDKNEVDVWCTLKSNTEINNYKKAIFDRNFMQARQVSWNVNTINESCKALKLREIVQKAKEEGRKILAGYFFT